ncbi:MAG: Uma2 family endonuclease [Myxococcales bacterium]|nr:Uma2 family endonuclease [Myxococcales bacterium]
MRDFAHHRYTWAEYLAFERASNAKNEFFNGEIYAMAGGSPEHAKLSARVIRELGNHLRGKNCEPFTSDLRVRVAATGLATYPDVSVICGKTETDPQDPSTALNPTVLVEVLSASTEEYDRGEKFEQFKQIASLREYVLVSHREPLVEVFGRTGDGAWARVEARARSSARLASIDCELPVDVLYEGIALP